MDFHHQLKNKTTTHHTQIERAPRLIKLITADLALDEYAALIKKFYGYIAPCETIIRELPDNALLANREKTALLEQDLLALGIEQDTLQTISRCTRIPSFHSRADLLGYLYVMEGSTLGGQFITKVLRQKLPLTPESGIQYFNGYGKNTKAAWDNFCQLLNQNTEETQQKKIVAAVKQTYTTLYDWMLTD